MTDQKNEKKPVSVHYYIIIAIFLLIFIVVVSPLSYPVKVGLVLGLFALQFVIAFLHTRKNK